LPRIAIDPAKCQGHGRCALIAPSYFEVDDTGFGRVLVDEVAEVDRADVDEAVLSCPENAMRLLD
jgi:ferredoxin